MWLASTRRSVPSGRNDTIDAEYLDVGVQLSHGAEMPSWIRPSGASTRLLLSPTPAGSVSTMRRLVKWVPTSPLYASTRSFDAT